MKGLCDCCGQQREVTCTNGAFSFCPECPSNCTHEPRPLWVESPELSETPESATELERQIRVLLDRYNEQHHAETGCTCRTILAGMTAHGCPQHDCHDE